MTSTMRRRVTIFLKAPSSGTQTNPKLSVSREKHIQFTLISLRGHFASARTHATLPTLTLRTIWPIRTTKVSVEVPAYLSTLICTRSTLQICVLYVCRILSSFPSDLAVTWHRDIPSYTHDANPKTKTLLGLEVQFGSIEFWQL